MKMQGLSPRWLWIFGRLECRREEERGLVSGEMRRYWEEHECEGAFSGLCLTLRCESPRGSGRLDTPVVLAVNDGY